VTSSTDWSAWDATTRSFGSPNAPPVAATFSLQPGQQFGAFTIVRPLGSGGMGEVYEAEEQESGRRVALKVLSRSTASSGQSARFVREGQLAAGISHPHTIYVYGTDEIQGVPVIAMELAPGGTLKDLVKLRGVAPPAQAVDVILQVIAGLEAAADAGVLHRDIKPSNCFIDSDGLVKVGDFGLSISTFPTEDRTMTMLAAFGTPAYASPEQMKGDPVDVRSEIYSVGGTLYFLLTGRAPFEDGHVGRLMSQVAQETPASPRSIRPDIPRELSALVLRCLAKRPSERFASYQDLREALEPFSSAAPTPARLGLRFMAGFVDSVLLWMLALPVVAWLADPLMPGRREGMVETSLVTWLVDILYYGIPEGRWGRSLGKQVFGLRVVDESGQRPGIPRALARAALWIVAIGAPMLAYGYALAPVSVASQDTPFGAVIGFSFPVLALLLTAAMFSTARRANGYAGLHDLATGTRVVLKKALEVRPRTTQRLAVPAAPAHAARTGPYVMLEEQPSGGEHVRVGYDDRLKRRVWIRQARRGEPAVSAERRSLSRSTRLRWLSGRRSEREAWDAYEAADGQPLTALLGQPHSWSNVRHWIADLALEIRASLLEGSPASLSLAHVWISNAGRARLLDWPVPPDRSSGDSNVDINRAQAFLHELAVEALDPASPTADGRPRAPLPLDARAFIERLGRGAFGDADALAASAGALAREPATVSRGRRFGHLASCSLLPLLVALFMVSMFWLFTGPMMSDQALGELTECLLRLDRLQERPERARQPGEARALELFIASRHRARIEDPATWTERLSLLRIDPDLKAIAQRALATHPAPATADVRSAESIVEPYLARQKEVFDRMRAPSGLGAMLLLFVVGTSLFLAGLGLLSAVIFRGGLALRLFGAAVVGSDGQETGRWRALLRALVAWSPAVLAALAVARSPDPLIANSGWMIPAAGSVALFLAGAAYAVRHPDRGLQDRFAGTTLVPR
jgi:uncharacterized RDD family membrane protein YckC